MNITNLTSTYMNGNISGKILENYKNKNFFDNSVINKINCIQDNNQGLNSNVGNNIFNIVALILFSLYTQK